MRRLFQFQQNGPTPLHRRWGLKHEKFLWETKGGPYKDPENPTLEALFAERVEARYHRAREVGQPPGADGKRERAEELIGRTWSR